jgi:hypothetical protein
MPDQIRIDAVSNYLNTYKGQFPEEVLKQQLLNSGYTQEEIDAATNIATIDEPLEQSSQASTQAQFSQQPQANSVSQGQGKPLNIKLIAIVGAAILVLGVGGYFGYNAFFGNKDNDKKDESTKKDSDVLEFSEYSKWPGELSSSRVESRLARAYLIARFGDLDKKTVDSKNIGDTKFYDDNGIDYLSVRLDDGSEGVEAFSSSSKSYAALAYALFNNKSNTKFDPADADNEIIEDPSGDLIKKLELALEALGPEIKDNGMIDIPENLDDIEWYSSQHSSDMPADLFSMGKSICIKRPDGWTQITLHLDDGSGDFSGYRGLSIITDDDDKIVGIVFGVTVTEKSGF